MGEQGIPADEQMQPAEFRAVREYLGLTHEWVAAGLGVTDRTVRSWESGRHPIPDGVRVEVERWEAHAASAVGQVVERALDAPDPVVLVPRDGDLDGWPARWWRHVTMRAAVEVPGLVVQYRD